MTFLELAQKVLAEATNPLTSTAIWQIAVEKGYDKQLNSQGKTPGATLGAQIYVNVKNKANSPFATVDSRPKRFYLKSMAHLFYLTKVVDEEVLEVKQKQKDKNHFLEKDLHPYLAYFANYTFGCYCKTIKHHYFNKKEFGEWVHPDMVAAVFSMEDWKPEVFDFSKALGVRGVVLYSFELKRELSFANLRESFFQCVSNSSWANEAYLVTAKLADNEDFFDELSRLCASFGIGVIQINVVDIHLSEVLIPAQHREKLDFETINKIAMNPDFKEFLENVRIDLNSEKVHAKEYDAIEEPQAISKN